MITRIWHGWTTLEQADAYEMLLRSEVLPAIRGRSLAGFHGVSLLRRTLPTEVEFVTIMRFESLAAVREFAGVDWENAVVPPAARALLLRFDERSAHYETIVSEDR